MLLDIGATLLNLFLAYLALGLLFAVVFVFSGLSRVDDAASKPSVGFRLVILPGLAICWPIVLALWIRALRDGEPGASNAEPFDPEAAVQSARDLTDFTEAETRP